MMLQKICLAAGFTFVNTTGTPNCSMAIVEIGKRCLRFSMILGAWRSSQWHLETRGVIWRKSMIWTVAVWAMTVLIRSPTYRSVVSGTTHHTCKYPFVGLYWIIGRMLVIQIQCDVFYPVLDGTLTRSATSSAV